MVHFAFALLAVTPCSVRLGGDRRCWRHYDV